MQANIKDTLEKRVLSDLDYVLSYKPVAIGAKSAKHFASMSVIKPIALNAYPQIYIDLIKRFESDEAYQRLKRLGLREPKFLYAGFPELLKKSQRFTEIFKDASETHLHSKLVFKDKVMENKKLKSCSIEVHDCFFCSEIEPFEDIEVPYCTPNCGLFENIYNIKSLYKRDMEPRLIQIEAIKSAEYDGDTCEYQLTVID